MIWPPLHFVSWELALYFVCKLLSTHSLEKIFLLLSPPPLLFPPDFGEDHKQRAGFTFSCSMSYHPASTFLLDACTFPCSNYYNISIPLVKGGERVLPCLSKYYSRVPSTHHSQQSAPYSITCPLRTSKA